MTTIITLLPADKVYPTGFNDLNANFAALNAGKLETANWVIGESPNGVGGGNLVFTLLFSPVVGMIAVYVDGVRIPNNGFGFVGTTLTLSSPAPTSSLVVDYYHT